MRPLGVAELRRGVACVREHVVTLRDTLGRDRGDAGCLGRVTVRYMRRYLLKPCVVGSPYGEMLKCRMWTIAICIWGSTRPCL